MNFFDHQDAAKRATRRLVVLFVLSLIGVGVLLYVPVAIAMASEAAKRGGARGAAWWDPTTFLMIFGAAAAIILLGAGVKRMQLRGGGKAVAESLGGRWLNPAGASPSERRLLDVVEEMSIASGMPVPPVYVMEDDSINAFAAGNTPKDAVLGFTSGAIAQLPRDELQGVVAHEFSHIAHGDTRLNVRLACAVAGVMVIMLIGRVVLSIAARAPASRSKKDDGRAGIALFGVLLLVVGGLGAFFGRILQAAVSRQREFLADASAAQYTRDPAALAGALRRIAGLGPNHMSQDSASGMNHFFFTSAVNTWLASHPPIEERIRRLEGAAVAPAATPATTSATGTPAVAALSGGAPTRQRPHLDAQPADGVGVPSDMIRRVGPIMHRLLPKHIAEACTEPLDAQAVLLLTAWSSDASARSRQRDIVRQRLGPAMASTVSRLSAPMESLKDALRLMVLDLCMPALQQLSQPQYMAFREALTEVIRADGSVSLFEWTMRSVLARRVEARFGALADRPGNATLRSRQKEAWILLSALAWAGDAARARQAAARGLDHLQLPIQDPAPGAQCTLDAVDASLERLAELRDADRHRVVEAAAATVAEDALMQPQELLLLRAVADRLNVLIPSSIELLEQDAPGALLDP